MALLDALASYLRDQGLTAAVEDSVNGLVISVTGLKRPVTLYLFEDVLAIGVPYQHPDIDRADRVVERFELSNPSTTPELIESRILHHAIPPDKDTSGGICHGPVC